MTFEQFLQALFNQDPKDGPGEVAKDEASLLDMRVNEFLQETFNHKGPFTTTQREWGRQMVLKQIQDDVVEELRNEPLDGPAAQDLSVSDEGGEMVQLIEVSFKKRSVESASMLAAASHKPLTKESVQEAMELLFELKWKQGEHTWIMEGHRSSKDAEVVLICSDGTPTTPNSIAWKNSFTGEMDHFDVNTEKDGHFVVDIELPRALKRAEVVDDTLGETEQNRKLPIVQYVKEEENG